MTKRSRGRQVPKTPHTVRNVFIGLAILVLIGAMALIVPKLLPRDDNWITFVQPAQGGFTPEQQKLITTAALDWNDKLECGREIEIIPWSGFIKNTFADGSQEIAVEEAAPGYMKVLTTTVGLYVVDSADDFDKDLRNTVLHAMTHACLPDGAESITPQPYFGDQIVGYSGASLEVLTAADKKTRIDHLEEALAEMFASSFKGYASNPGYVRAGTLALNEFAGHDPRVIWELLRKHDVPGLVTLSTRKTNPTFEDILIFIEEYADVIKN